MTNKQLTIPEAVRALTVGDCPTRREAVKTIREYFENGDPLETIREEITQVAEEESKIDKKWAQGLKYALKIIDKYKAESEDE